MPVVLLTKADLVEDYSQQIAEVESIAVGVSIIPISSKTGYGLEQLSPFLSKGKTIVFLGSSGVGKSSLVNALSGETLMKTSGIRESDSKGHHTTTHRQLFRLEHGAMIIDTPGMRELGMWDVTEGLGKAFDDIAMLISQCKFSNCTHHKEPGCAICEAIATGNLEEKRWQRYLKLKKEARYFEDKAKYHADMKKVGKNRAKYCRQIAKKF